MEGRKTTTIRLGINEKYHENDMVEVSSGWSEVDAQPILLVRIVSVQHKKIAELTDIDLQGESPDCSTSEAVPYVLSAIYRKIVSTQDNITVIKLKNIKKIS